jgi:hypothetical protein
MARMGRVVANLGQGQVFRFYRTSLLNPFRCLRRVAVSTGTIVDQGTTVVDMGGGRWNSREGAFGLLPAKSPPAVCSNITPMYGVPMPMLNERFSLFIRTVVDAMDVKWFATPWV